jgi:hypothetical protein
MNPEEHPYYQKIMRRRKKEQALFSQKYTSLIELISWDISTIVFKLTNRRLKKDFHKKWSTYNIE